MAVPWRLSRQETASSFEAWRQTIQGFFALDPNFVNFLEEGTIWLRKSRACPLRGIQDDDNNIPPETWRSASQKLLHLETFLLQLVTYAPIVSRHSIVSSSTSAASIWQMIHIHYGFSTTSYESSQQPSTAPCSQHQYQSDDDGQFVLHPLCSRTSMYANCNNDYRDPIADMRPHSISECRPAVNTAMTVTSHNPRPSFDASDTASNTVVTSPAPEQVTPKMSSPYDTNPECNDLPPIQTLFAPDESDIDHDVTFPIFGINFLHICPSFHRPLTSHDTSETYHLPHMMRVLNDAMRHHEASLSPFKAVTVPWYTRAMCFMLQLLLFASFPQQPPPPPWPPPAWIHACIPAGSLSR